MTADERVNHARAKYHIARRLTAAIDAVGVDCETFIDGLAVVVDATTVYQPDVLVRNRSGWRDGADLRSGDRGGSVVALDQGV
jgi:hypothetical protein